MTEEINEWNANSVVIDNSQKYFEEIPLIQTGIHKDVAKVAVCVVPAGLCKVVVIQNPEVAARFRAALAQDPNILRHLTIPARVIRLENVGTREKHPKMQITDAFETQRTLWYDGPFDPFETNVFVIGKCQMVRVTCFDNHSWKSSDESHCQLVHEDVPDSKPQLHELPKNVKRGRGRSRY